MRKSIFARCSQLVAFLICLTFVCGCSWLAELVVENRTATPITVLLQYIIYEPSVLGVEKVANMSSLDKKWDGLGGKDFFYDSQAKTLKITIDPSEALLVDKVLNYLGPDKSSNAHINLHSISVLGKGEVVKYEATQLIKMFKRINKRVWVMSL